MQTAEGCTDQIKGNNLEMGEKMHNFLEQIYMLAP
jgi:hypothetical protein